MQVSFAIPIIVSLVFGLVVSGGEHLIRGWAGWRPWLGLAFRLMCLAYIILFGVIKV